MPIKYKTAAGLQDIIDRKVSNGDGTFRGVNKVLVKRDDGTLATVWERPEPVTVEEFSYTIDTGVAGVSTMYAIPAYNPFPYNWLIDWGDGNSETVTGTGATNRVINHTYAARGEYTVTITPAGSKDAWLKAFGAGEFTAVANSLKIISCAAVLTPLMVASEAEIAVGVIGDRCFSGWFNGNVNATNLSCTFSKDWGKITAVGDYFCYFMFYGCTGLTVLSNDSTLPPNITTVGDSFCYYMFYGCTGLTVLPDGFNLPPNITTVGDSFCGNMFYRCTGLTALPTGFNIPQNIISAMATYFCYGMFSDCTGLTVLPTGFNIPPGITAVGTQFLSYMFSGCTNLASLPNGFNIPPSITTVGTYFLVNMFYGCASLVSLPDGFNIPQGITTVGGNFMQGMFRGCSLLSGLPDGFNLPQGITAVSMHFCDSLFYMCPNLIVNSDFKFPVLAATELAKTDVFSDMFYMSYVYGTVLAQNRTAASIINGNTVPPTDRNTFTCYNDVQGAARWSDYMSLDVNWR